MWIYDKNKILSDTKHKDLYQIQYKQLIKHLNHKLQES